MTARKLNLPLPSRTPAYVSREVGAAELHISPETWDNWVARKILPPPAPGFPDGTPRWRWADVDACLSRRSFEVMHGSAVAHDLQDGNVIDPFVANAGKLKNVPTKGKRNDRSAARGACRPQ